MSDIEKVKKLREATGAGFKDCNLAIKESGGDLDKAVEILRVKGISKASKKMSRDAKEGVVAVSGDQNKTSIIEVNCETDFVAKNDDFINFVKELSELNNQNNSNIEILKKSKCMNPVIYFDELDKVSETPKGEEIINLLIHMTDFSQNDHFMDKYYNDIPIDLSKALFIFSLNDVNRVNPILRDRMYMI